jgi:kojibiose phosphorylase
VVLDWDGTAVTSRAADASRAIGLIDRLLGLGVRVGIITGTNLDNLRRQMGAGITAEHGRRLFLCTNRGSEAFGLDRHGGPVLLHRRVATPEEDRLLDAVVDAVEARLQALTGLAFEVVRDRMNRRKIDLYPDPRFHDPPKSAIGELLAATEARLRGAGLRGGLAGVFELTQRIARELGLAGARVTSDVKHVELGLTDKADSMAWLMREVAAPLEIPSADVLVVGDELGPIAGLEGSDHRMLDVPGAEGAVVVSVGPEPGGAPPGVLHLGGGPERFCEICEHQIAEGGRRGPFAPPRDAAWLVDEPGFDVAREHEIESLLSIANGYVGSRASIAEGTSVSRPATFLAGAYEASADLSTVPELLVAPDWGRLRFTIAGSPFRVEEGEMLHHRRVLDMRRGVLLREGKERGGAGHVTRVSTIHLASLAERHLLVEGVEVCAENYSGPLTVDAIVGGEVKSESGARHWEGFDTSFRDGGPLVQGTSRGGLRVAMASHMALERPEGAAVAVSFELGPSAAAERYELQLRIDEPQELYRTVALYTSRDAPAPEGAALDLRRAVASEPLSRLVAEHEAAWAERWRRASVIIDGAPRLERAVRFACYHLIAAANPEDPRCSIGARSLSGEAYRGHVFWDTEIFMLPFFLHTWPEAARALVGYRHRTLPGARRKAASSGYRGALYAWESTDTGDETTPTAVLSPRGEILRVFSGAEEQHISADVAYGVAAYVRATGDLAFLRGPGLEILVETARFWASRVERGPDGHAHVRRVMGPDEYHDCIDDNAFTNWMARFNLRAAARAARAWPEDAARLGVSDDEARAMEAAADAIYACLSPEIGVLEQFAGFFGLERVDLASLGVEHMPADMILGRERTRRTQIVKQADVVQLLALLWDEIPAEVRRRSFLYYEPITAHGSSLSPGVHALVALRLGLVDAAARYLEQTAEIDLGNTHGNSAGGVHAAALGSLWQAVVLGAGGVRPAPDDLDAIVVEPHLCPGWRALAFPFAWRGRGLRVTIEPDAIEVEVEEGAPLEIRAGAAATRAEPGVRYAARRDGGGFSRWEAIS